MADTVNQESILFRDQTGVPGIIMTIPDKKITIYLHNEEKIELEKFNSAFVGVVYGPFNSEFNLAINSMRIESYASTFFCSYGGVRVENGYGIIICIEDQIIGPATSPIIPEVFSEPNDDGISTNTDFEFDLLSIKILRLSPSIDFNLNKVELETIVLIIDNCLMIDTDNGPVTLNSGSIVKIEKDKGCDFQVLNEPVVLALIKLN